VAAVKLENSIRILAQRTDHKALDTRCSCNLEERHFFMLTTTDATPERWQHTAEQVLRFTLFWAPLDALPPLRSSQAAWLSMLVPPA
jgi:hypothetical protein